MRVHDIPRVRMLWIVTMKFTAPATVETVRRWSERIQRSCPFPGAWIESGGYAVQPVSAAPPSAKKLSMSTPPPKRKNQYESAFSARERHVRARRS